MKVGVPTEIKDDEYRVALTPVGARELAEHGHEVLIQQGAGEGSSISDADFEAQGARIVSLDDVWAEPDLILGVKEPQPEEVARLRPEAMLKFLDEKIRTLGTAACPPYHLAIVIGGTSAELNLKTVKLASTRYLDHLPVEMPSGEEVTIEGEHITADRQLIITTTGEVIPNEPVLE